MVFPLLCNNRAIYPTIVRTKKLTLLNQVPAIFFAVLSKRGRFSKSTLFKNFMFSLQGAKGFYDQLLISALLFWILIRRSNTANLVRNLVYIILVSYRPGRVHGDHDVQFKWRANGHRRTATKNSPGKSKDLDITQRRAEVGSERKQMGVTFNCYLIKGSY